MARGPRGGLVMWSTCARCGLERRDNRDWRRGPMPPCRGAPFWDPRTDLWLARFAELNRRARPAPLPLLAELGEWWG